MNYGFGPYGAFPYGSISSEIHAEDPALVAFLQAPAVEQNYVVSLFLLSRQPDQEPNGGGYYGSGPYGAGPYGGASTVTSAGIVEHSYSSKGYTSQLSDSPANTYYDARLKQPITFSRGIEQTERLSGLTDLSGDIEIENGDGALDLLFEQNSADGRSVRARIGRSENALSTFGDLFTGRIAFSEAFTERVVIGVSDGMVALRKPIQTNLYLGTGGLEGGEDLKGRPKPITLGYVFNASCPLVDAANLEYQANDGEIGDVPAVKDRGVHLTKVSGTPGLGEYSVNATLGTFKLGGAPAGTVTANIVGLITTTAEIIRHIVMNYGGLTDSEIASSSFSSAIAYAGVDAGYWVGTDPHMITDVVTALLDGVGGNAGFNRFGRFEFGVLGEAVGPIVAELTKEENIKTFERIPMPTALNPLVWRVSCGWTQNETVQNDLAGSVSDAVKAFSSQPFRVATVEDSSLKGVHLLAQDITVHSRFRNQADALGEAQRLFNLYSVPRALYRMTVSMAGILVGFGDVVNITFPRYGLNSGKLGTVVGQRFDAAMGETELTVFV